MLRRKEKKRKEETSTPLIIHITSKFVNKKAENNYLTLLREFSPMKAWCYISTFPLKSQKVLYAKGSNNGRD